MGGQQEQVMANWRDYSSTNYAYEPFEGDEAQRFAAAAAAANGAALAGADFRYKKTHSIETLSPKKIELGHGISYSHCRAHGTTIIE